MVVMFEERLNLGFEIAGEIVILQQDAVFKVWCQRAILPYIGMERCTRVRTT
jgi:hypothetical protein